MPTLIIRTETVEQLDEVLAVITDAEAEEILDFPFNTQTDYSEVHHAS